MSVPDGPRSSDVPGKPRNAERRLETALRALAKALDGLGVPWMVIGGLAVVARGVRRMTTDIDAVVRGDAAKLEGVVAALAEQAIEPRIDDALAFARKNLVLLLRHEPTEVQLDLSLGWTTFEHEALAVRSDARFGRVSAPFARAEDLVIFKALAARPKDIDDATALLVLHGDIDLARVRRRVRELAELAEEPGLAQGLEAVIAAARPHSPKSPPRARKKRSPGAR